MENNNIPNDMLMAASVREKLKQREQSNNPQPATPITPPPTSNPTILNQSIPKQKKGHLFLGSLIFYFIIAGIQLLLIKVYSSRTLTTEMIVGILIMSLGVTLIFALVAFIVRKIGNKFGTLAYITSWILIFVALIGTGWYIGSHQPVIYRTAGTVIVSDHKISLNECLTTKDDVAKMACGTDYAIELKDRSICRKVYGNNDIGYYCEMNYDETVGYTPSTIEECQSMVAADNGSTFYRDSCFTGVAIVKMDKSICNYIANTQNKEGCADTVDGTAYKKEKLCGPLFVDGKFPHNYECDEYVYSQHDLAKCSLLKGTWNQNGCKQYVTAFNSIKSEYDKAKALKTGAINNFNRLGLSKKCSYLGVGGGTAATFRGICEFSKSDDGQQILIKMKNTSFVPLVFDKATFFDVMNKNNETLTTCQSPTIKDIDGSTNLAVQIDKDETFVLKISCTTGSLKDITYIGISHKFSGSMFNSNATLRIDLTK